MEAALVHAVRSHLVVHPPLSAIDVIRAAQLVTRGCHVEVRDIVHILNIVARDQDDVIPAEVLKRLRTLLMNDLVEDILGLEPAPKCCCWW